MKLEDIIALAKQGYKPNDIKELIEMASTSEPEAEVTDTPADNVDTPDEPQPEAKAEEPEVDYKKLYESEHEKLVKAQQANVSSNISNNVNAKSDDEIVADFCRSFFN